MDSTRRCRLRYHPYSQVQALPRPPASSPATLKLLKDARDHLRFYNAEGLMVSWAGEDWDILARPTRVTANTTQPVGAASFPSVPGFEYPLCPHRDSFGRPYAPMKLHLNRIHDGKRQDFFRAGDHLCEFMVLIPKIRPPVYSTARNDDEDNDLDADDSDRIPCPNARISSSSSTITTTHPRPTPRRRSDTSSHHSYFSESVFKARAHADLKVVDACWDGVWTGLFESTPCAHPAFPHPGKSTHPVLQLYDDKSPSNCLNRMFQELKFLGTAVGQALRALTSTLGATWDVLQTIIQDCAPCPVCRCQFSHDGYNDHIRDGFCRNCPTPTKVALLPPIDYQPHELSLRSLPSGKQLGSSVEFLDSPIGAALMEWNSKVGVPLDVWALASTATIDYWSV
ncbi:hypothetical protein C8R45DRAFT_1212490 [Mycena sanguinolenta]|nr:hypothetical protein C8R45DRAFT_1212490 [Mycena sanguinolenta]